MSREITEHYSFGGLRERIEQGLAMAGQPATIELLGAADEFHLGGRPATAHLVAQLDLDDTDHVLDIGSGIGGTARYIAATTAAHVTGVDLTPEYVEVATWLTSLVGLQDLAQFVLGSAAELPPRDQRFTAATMVHVGMNIANKRAVFAGVADQLETGATFAIYDLMVTGDGRPEYPVPWAATAATSELESVDDYTSHLGDAGFSTVAIDDRTETVLVGLDQLAVARQTQDGPPPLGLHLVMGPTAPAKFSNLAAAVRSGMIAPTEIIARKN